VNKIASVALNTFRESIREKILAVALLFGLILMGSSVLLSPLAVGAKQKIVMDVGLAAISIIGVLTAVFLGSTLVHKETDKKAIYLVLTRPISRSSFLAGKLVGIVLAIALVFAVMTAVMLGTVALGRGIVSPAVFASVYLSFLETTVMCSIVMFFSTFTTPMLTSFFALCIFAAGNLSGDLKVFASKFGGEGMKLVSGSLYYLLPNLKVFNLRHEAVHNLPFEAGDVLRATLYAVVYCAVILFFACSVFRRREFK
jgi:ABC-type transport system involved in multi-copper enzyme maturation permease subunit